MRDVGEMGQKEVEKWAPQVGIVANPVMRDRSGWDILLELPPATDSRLPPDRRGHSAQCLIQVKSTDAHLGRWSVKLDNWLRFIQSPLPAFFLVLEFDGANDCQRAFLVHVDEVLIERVLRRIRELSVASPALALHKATFSFRYSSEHLLQTSDGQGLLNALQTHVPNFASYSAEKQRYLQTVGYEAGMNILEAELEFAPDDPHRSFEEMLLDWSLGLNRNLSIRPGAMVYDQRFGIRYPEPLRTIETPGRVDAQPAGRGLVRLRTLDGSQERTLQVEVFGSGGLTGYIADDKHVVRIAAPFLDLFVPLSFPSKWQSVVRVPTPNAEFSLVELRPLSDLVLLFSDGAKDGGIEVDAQFDAAPPFCGKLEFTSGPTSDLLELAQAIRCALQITKQVNLSNSTVTCVNEIYGQRVALLAIRNFLAGTPEGFFYFSSSDPLPADRICFPFVIYARLGGHIITFAAGQIGLAEATGKIEDQSREYQFTLEQVRIVEVTATERGVLPRVSREKTLDKVAEACDDFSVMYWWGEE